MRRLHAARWLVPALVAASLAVGAAGCQSCKNEHPYVPFTIDGAPVEGDDADTVPSDASLDAGPAIDDPADVAPPTTAKWPLNGVELSAPAGYLFALGLVRDFDGDGNVDAFATLFPATAQGAQALGQVVFYRGLPKVNGAPALAAPIVILQSTDSMDAACSPAPRLVRVGHRSVAAELGAKCTGHTRPPPRLFAVLAAPAAHAEAGATAKVTLSTRVVDPPGAPSLHIAADGSDRDGDGIEDVALTLSVEGGSAPFEPGPHESAVLRWFDRPAGLSSDPEEPEASLRARADRAVVKAGRAKDAPSVPEMVRQLRFLYGAICGDGKMARFQPTSGTGALSCPPSRAVEELGLAEARAWATLGDPIRAGAALMAAEEPPATQTPARVKDALGWLKSLAPPSEANQVRAVSAVPQLAPSKNQPAWGALAFEPSGKLLVRTTAGVVRVDPSAGDETDASDVTPWKWQVVSPAASDIRFTGVVSSCDGVAAHGAFVSADEPVDVPLPLGPILSSRCTNGLGDERRTRMLAWGGGGVEALVDGMPILVSPDLAHASSPATPLEMSPAHGAARSPSGKATVLPTPYGLMVGMTGSPKGRLLISQQLDGSYMDLRDCTVSDDATRVACVRGGKVVVGLWSTP